MIEKGKELWEILIPTIRHNGKPFRTRYHRVWDKKVRELAGGLTILPPTFGQWIAPDSEVYKERMIPVRIMCTPEALSLILDMTVEYYNQDAVLAYKISNECIIRTRDGI